MQNTIVTNWSSSVFIYSQYHILGQAAASWYHLNRPWVIIPFWFFVYFSQPHHPRWSSHWIVPTHPHQWFLETTNEFETICIHTGKFEAVWRPRTVSPSSHLAGVLAPFVFVLLLEGEFPCQILLLQHSFTFSCPKTGEAAGILLCSRVRVSQITTDAGLASEKRYWTLSTRC